MTSLMKAQAYELQALPQRKKASCVYQFNLISSLDGQLVRLDFDDSGVRAVSVDTEHYIARYIVHKKETFARVHFVCIDSLEAVLDDYDRLHQANVAFFDQQIDYFYQNIFLDSKRLDVLQEEFFQAVRWRIESASRRRLGHEIDAKGLSLYWNAKEQTLCLALDNGEDSMDALNSDTDLSKEIRAALKKVFGLREILNSCLMTSPSDGHVASADRRSRGFHDSSLNSLAQCLTPRNVR